MRTHIDTPSSSSLFGYEACSKHIYNVIYVCVYGYRLENENINECILLYSPCTRIVRAYRLHVSILKNRAVNL